MTNSPFAHLSIVHRLPHWRNVESEGDAIPSDIEGACIVCFGSPPSQTKVEGGGLLIDYIPAGSDAIKRVVFGFTELGMWIEYEGPCAP